ncbi:arginine--tRNA ligase [Clostridium sp. C105KSO13]|uniref:arginine--tRNA ligase n=1 Tax=Clostridium sp. C105KSO13 TaxID=1776045 RepID=UPI000740775D|nr:arginine--tRNA ligase [Clostridium sp. C105KSO13]CUX20609.1 Arginine--tRNA ligase [Clostridium sp. C105KSO13]
MKTLLEVITIEMQKAFESAGVDASFAKVTLSNRPDLCEYQCNGAMAAAKTYKKAPIQIANAVVEKLQSCEYFSEAVAVQPGFINMKAAPSFVAKYLNQMAVSENLGSEKEEKPKTIIIDYGGPNVAKPLHVGHLRSAIIGESVKRTARFKGNKVISDIHMGDWGYQMGLIITELERRQPKLPYFDENYKGEYPKEAPFTIGELEEIYPTASAYAKEHDEYREKALHATYLLQNGHRGYRALWGHIMKVSVADLKKNYEQLNVEFDLWKGESDVQKYIPGMVERLKDTHYAHYDEGALVVDVQEKGDKKEVPPCMILKSDGAALYDTTDLATLLEREELYKPDEIIYVVDKRQELHFVQVFRCAKKTEIAGQGTDLKFLGFGTMNGKDGKPFKTREGGVMRLENLIRDIVEEMYQKIMDNRTVSEEEALHTARIVGLAALKYGDLSNQASKDYVFDVDRFTSFEGNTGPYILYTIVRIKSILNKYKEMHGTLDGLAIQEPSDGFEKTLMLEAVKFNDVIETVYEESAPHKNCAYIYDLANAFNKFYHETKILTEEDETKQSGYIALLKLVKEILETCIDLLGFEAPERM